MYAVTRAGTVVALVALAASCGAPIAPRAGEQEPAPSAEPAEPAAGDSRALAPVPAGESATVVCDPVEGYEVPVGTPVAELGSERFTEALAELGDWTHTCGNSHGAGTVELELTVGADGRPIAVAPIGELAGTMLARCAADLACRLTLPPLAQESTFTYTVTIAPMTR